MNRKELNELKKRFKIEQCAITRMRGCYVSQDGECLGTMNKLFLSLPEEEIFKYLRMFAGCMKGRLGEKLQNLHMADGDPYETVSESLEALRKTKLKDEETFMRICTKIMENYEATSNYMILAIHDVYDIPGVTEDGAEMEDASDSVYEYIVLYICPVYQPMPYIGLQPGNQFGAVTPPFCIAAPRIALTYPAFNDRRADPRGTLLYQAEGMCGESIVKTLCQCEVGMSDTQKKDIIQKIFESSLSESSSFKQLKKIYEIVTGRLLEWERDTDLMMNKEDVMSILEEAGIPEEQTELFAEEWDNRFGKNESVPAKKIIDEKKLRVETEGAVINVKPEGLSKTMIEHTNGDVFLTIQITGRTEVNGVATKGGDAG